MKRTRAQVRTHAWCPVHVESDRFRPVPSEDVKRFHEVDQLHNGDSVLGIKFGRILEVWDPVGCQAPGASRKSLPCPASGDFNYTCATRTRLPALPMYVPQHVPPSPGIGGNHDLATAALRHSQLTDEVCFKPLFFVLADSRQLPWSQQRKYCHGHHLRKSNREAGFWQALKHRSTIKSCVSNKLKPTKNPWLLQQKTKPPWRANAKSTCPFRPRHPRTAQLSDHDLLELGRKSFRDQFTALGAGSKERAGREVRNGKVFFGWAKVQVFFGGGCWLSLSAFWCLMGKFGWFGGQNPNGFDGGF